MFGLGKNDEEEIGPPADIKWVRNPKGRFHNLMFVDTVAESLKGVSGIYVIWSGGAASKWLFVGVSKDLATTLDAKIDDPEIEEYYESAGVYVTWSLVKPEFQGGIIRYLTEAMKPEIENPDAKRYANEKPIAVFFPGKEKAVA